MNGSPARITALGRAPDALGLHYWAGQLARGVDPGVLADFFFNDAVDSLYSGPDGDAVVGSACRAILGREAGADEITFWLGYAAELDLDPGQLPRAIVGAARSGEGEHISLKSALSAYYALANGLGGGDGALAMYQATSLQAGRDLADSLRADAAAGGELTVSVVALDLSAFGLPL